ncbi:MAG: TonB-dependent siderophore receptor [Gammaproteobacteria bacterium]|nr:TonB-dependent siderophore receptor [Gammaproteobacteria bacterium]
MLGLGLPSLAQAQDAAAVQRLSTVKVSAEAEQAKRYAAKTTRTATKTDTPLRDVPQAVTVVTQALIKDQAMQSMADVVRYVPGVGMASGEGNRDTPIFRGNSTTADFFIDGLRDDVQYLRDLYNIERVEALKGSNAMIFGRGGSGGVINRVSKQANWQDGSELGLQLGSWNNRRASLDVNQALDETAALRVTGVYEKSDSFRDGFELERQGINPTASFRLSEATRLELGYEHFEDERTADRGIPSYRGKPLAVGRSTFFGSPDVNRVEAEVDAFNALVEHDFAGGLNLRNRTRYASYDKFYQNLTPGAVNAAGSHVAFSAYNNATERDNLFNQTDLTYSLEAGSVVHTLLAGAELGRQVTDNFRQTGYFDGLGSNVSTAQVPLANLASLPAVSFRQKASDADNEGVATVATAYVQDQIAFTPAWQAVLGLRYDRFKVDLDNKRNNTSLDATDHLVSPRAGLIYKPVEEMSLYGSYSVAFLPRSGDQLSSLTASNQALDPEEFKNLELGAKWDLSDQLSASLAVYRLERSNVVAPDPSDATKSILVDGQRTRGMEFGLGGQLTEAWSVMGGYAYQDGEITKNLSATAKAGASLAQVPKHSASLWNRYDFSPAWGAGLGVIYRDEIYASTDNTVALPSFTRYDAALYYTASKTLKLQANVENLGDKTYYASANGNNNIAPGSPRALRVSATLRF